MRLLVCTSVAEHHAGVSCPWPIVVKDEPLAVLSNFVSSRISRAGYVPLSHIKTKFGIKQPMLAASPKAGQPAHRNTDTQFFNEDLAAELLR